MPGEQFAQTGKWLTLRGTVKRRLGSDVCGDKSPKFAELRLAVQVNCPW